jgi:D-threonate/D-erythronate kinase
MADVLVVADDLTGANAAAAGFARAGLRAATASAVERVDVVAEMTARFDVVVATTDSRHAPAADAAERVAAVVRAGWPARLVCNRIDTTLRGNVGATTEAVVNQVAELSGTRVVALCAPAHPAADRHTIGGTQLLRGERLEETEVARDARSPMRTSDVAEIIGQQTDLVVRGLPMSTVTGTPDDLLRAVREALDGGAEVLVADATTEAHLDRVAQAAVAATEGLELVWVTSDPGPASVAMARALGLEPRSASAPLLAVCGSATELTRAQLRQLAADRGAELHRTPTIAESAVPDVDATARLLDTVLTDADPDAVLVIATVLEEADLRPLTAEEAAEVPRALARAVRRTLEAHDVDGLFTTGGDATAAVLHELGSHGLEIADEVVPLAVAGTVVGGPWDGLPVVTKGGLVGDSGTTVACLDHLRAHATLHRRQVTATESRTAR